MLHLQGISKHYGIKRLFEGAEAHLGYRSRVALIGPNGAGKTTLIKIILGQESADAGTIARAKNLVIGHLAQEVPKFSGRNILAEVMSLDGRRESLHQMRQEYETLFTKEEAKSADLERYGRVLEEIESLDEYRLEPRAKEILSGMGFRTSDWDRPLTALSGGWLMRVALSRVLLMEPDLLLLDEPTNHLDLESLLWLEEFLRGFRGALLLVSHDTEFLNRMVEDVLEIDQMKIWNYHGNLDAYVVQKEERLKVLRSQYAGQQAKIAEIEAFVERFGAKATKARQAQSRLKTLEKMELIELPDDRSTVRFRFPPAPHSGKEVVTIKDASFAYGDKVLFQHLNWVIPRGSRMAIVGVNGAGKTTLLRLLAKKLDETEGEIKLGHAVKTGYYAQIQAESLNMSKTIAQELEAVAPEMPISQVRAIAGAFLFTGEAVEKKCAVLSGGEKARVALAKLLLSPSNFLLLDEPTNHLDIESRGVLLDALQTYNGTLVLISHDRAFVQPLVDTVLEIVPSAQGSTVHPLLGSYEDYLARKIAETTLAARGLKASPEKACDKSTSPKPNDIGTKGGPSNNKKLAWEKERAQLEEKISKTERERSELHEILGRPETYEDKEKSLELIEKQRKTDQELNTSLARWEEVCHLLDSIK